MNYWILGFFRILFLVCLVLSIYFIIQLVSKCCYFVEPYLSYDAIDDTISAETISGSIYGMINDISGTVSSISGDLNDISGYFGNDYLGDISAPWNS
jgi:hypothetical protein